MDYRGFYEFYKLELKAHKDEFTTDCPFCPDGENHLYISQSTGLYECKKCQCRGNHLTFITKLHQMYLKQTTKSQYQYLYKLRGIPVEEFQLAKFAYDAVHDRWFVPYQNGSEFLKSLGVFYPSSSVQKNRFKIFKPTGIDLTLYRPFDTKELTKDVWACEGEWDVLAMHAICRSTKKSIHSLISMPGSMVWKEEFNKICKGRNLIYFFDHDEAGEKGKKNIVNKASGFTYAFTKWIKSGFEEPPPDKYDVRQLLLDAESRKKAYKIVLDMVENADVLAEDIQPANAKAATGGFTVDFDDIEEVRTYSTFLTRIKENFYTNSSILQSIELVLGTALSVHLPGEPVWIFLVGPPSSGKSTVIEAFGGSNDYFEYASKITAETLISGWRGSKEASFLPMLNMKTFFIKDLTVILGLPDQVQQKLWDILRDAYDGYIKIVYGTGDVKEFTGFKFCMVAGVTHAIHNFNDADFGSRFLKVDFLGDDFDEDAHMDMAIANRLKKAENKSKFMHAMLGYYKYLVTSIDPANPPPIPKNIEDKCRALGKLVACLRTKITKDRYEGIKYRPVNEVGTRLALQFMNLVQGVAWVRQEKEVSYQTYLRVKKVAFDTCIGLNLEVLEYIFKKGKAVRAQIVEDLKLPKARVHQITNDFLQLGIIEYEKIPNSMGGQGRNQQRYIISEKVIECLKEVKEKSSKPSAKIKKSSTPSPKSKKSISRKLIRK